MQSVISFDGSKELMIGFRKPINALFLNVRNQVLTTKVSLTYFNGSTFTGVGSLNDLTFGLSRAGFLKWKKASNEVETTENGEKLFWYKLNLLNADGSALDAPVSVSFYGINLVFSDDFDLQVEFPTISQQLPEGAETFIRFHEAARDLLITDLRKSGVVINGSSRKQLDQWDLLDIEEVREASKHATLAKIFHWKSDEPNDKWTDLAKIHEAQAGESLIPLMSLDENDNGKNDERENVSAKPLIIGRL